MIGILRTCAVYLSSLALSFIDDKIKDGIEDGKINNAVICPRIPVKIEKHHNKGFAGNRLENRQDIVASVSSAFLSLQVLLAGNTALKTGSVLMNTANTLLLSGAFSNTRDRIRRRYVVDYLRIKDRIYNLSDFLIFAGALLSVLTVFLRADKDNYKD